MLWGFPACLGGVGAPAGTRPSLQGSYGSSFFTPTPSYFVPAGSSGLGILMCLCSQPERPGKPYHFHPDFWGCDLLCGPSESISPVCVPHAAVERGGALFTHFLSLLCCKLMDSIVPLPLSFKNSSIPLSLYSTVNVTHNITAQCFRTTLHLENNVNNY